MIRKVCAEQSGYVHVVFELPASLWAHHIALVGDFNGWDVTSTPFRQHRNGVWRVELELPRDRQFEFRYLVDSHWLTDYHADGLTANRDNSILDTQMHAPSYAPDFDSSMIHEGRTPAGHLLPASERARRKRCAGERPR